MVKKGVNLSRFDQKVNLEIQQASLPEKIILPLKIYGYSLLSLVKPKDKIKAGDKIAKSSGKDIFYMFSPVSGKIADIRKINSHLSPDEIDSIVIESDLKEQKKDFNSKECQLEKNECIGKIKDAGLFDRSSGDLLYKKLSTDEAIFNLIINCVDTPSSSIKKAILREKQKEFMQGIGILVTILDQENTIIAIRKDDKELYDSLAALEKLFEKKLTVQKIKPVYPYAHDRFLIYEAAKIALNSSQKPENFGCVVIDLETVLEIYESVCLSKPSYEKIISVAGMVNEPRILLAKAGTPVRNLIADCKGYKGSNENLNILAGGPFNGKKIEEDEPLTAETSEIYITKKGEEKKITNCINCAYCVKACPLGLMPILIAKSSEKQDIEKTSRYHIKECIGCGCCSYVCPEHIPLAEIIKRGKDLFG